MRASEFLSENSADLDKLNWFRIDDKWTGSYPMIKHIGQNIGATHWANWGRIGAPWNDREMIGGGGTYMMRGPFGHVMLDATTWPHKKLILLSQISVENRGSGLGEKIMNAIKSYADNSGFKVEIYKVTNPEFFRKFSWLDHDFTYTPGVNKNRAEEFKPLDEGWRDQLANAALAAAVTTGAGASCKGSVTHLRKMAAKASGERAKMYHWCANMKSGRKRSK